MEEDFLDLRLNQIQCSILGKDVEIHCDVEPTQFDNSLLNKILGLNRAFCKQCHHNVTTVNLLPNKQEGFQNSCPLEETLRRYHKLLQHPIVQRGEDFMKIPSATQKGTSHKPLRQDELLNYFVLPAKFFSK